MDVKEMDVIIVYGTILLFDAGDAFFMNIYYFLLLLIWLFVCAIYALREILAKKKRHSSDITAFTAFWASVVLAIYIFVSKDQVPFIEENWLLVAIAIGVIVVIVSLGITFNQRKNLRVVVRNLFVAIFAGIAAMLIAIFDVDFESLRIILLSATGAFLVATITCIIILQTKKYHLNIFSCVYVIISESFFLVFIYFIDVIEHSVMGFAIFMATFTIQAVYHILYSLIFANELNVVNYSVMEKQKELAKASEHISELVYINHDTKLPNIAKLEMDLDQQTYKPRFLIMLNLDNYKSLSNSMGFRKTAMIMTQISNSILWSMTERGHLYHISNDKFVIIYVGTNEECASDIKKLLDAFTLQDFFTINLKPYIGYTNVENRVFEFEAVLRELELASEAARESSSFQAPYTYDLYKKVQRRIVMETHLKNAVETKSWELYLQPKVSVQTNMIIGAEGLIRWKGQEGKIPPAAFIPLAEEMGLIVDIGKTIIEKGFAYAKAIADNVKPDFILAINLSAFQLMRKDFIEYIISIMKKYEVNPKNITFEITESAFIDNMDRVKDAVVKIRSHGFKFSLDDFGTGYSSISYLSKFELDEVKFDKEFMEDIEHDEKNLIILQTVTSLAKRLGLKIVTEGVESKKQLERIREIGCEVYQGYYFSKPVGINEFVALLKKNMRGEYFGMDE